MIIKFKKSQVKSVMLLLLSILLTSFLAYGMTVTLNAPATKSWWTTSSSVTHNWTVLTNGSETIDWCAMYSNRTGSNTLIANYTSGIYNGTPFTTGIAWAETKNNSMGWRIICYNGTIIASANASLGVDYTPPSITLDEPADGLYTNVMNYTYLYYTAIETNAPDSCLIYTNISIVWGINHTNTTYISGVQENMNLTINSTDAIFDGNYIWNVWCNDSGGNTEWAEDTNRTFTMDTIPPTNMVWESKNHTVSNDTTPYISWNQTTEIHFQKYQVLVSTSFSNFTPSVFQILEITNISTNYTNLSEIPDNDQYYIQVRAYDLAGNYMNTSSLLWYAVDSGLPSLTLNYPSNNSYLNNLSGIAPDFNITMIDDNPDSCVLYLSNISGTNAIVNKTINNVLNGTVYNITPTVMQDGTYKFNIECNDSKNIRLNVSNSNLDLTIDNTLPLRPNITSVWHLTNNTDKTPQLTWMTSTEANFARYLVEAVNVSGGNTVYAVNVTTRTTNYTSVSLIVGYTYNFSVTAYDLAGNSIKSANTTGTWYYVDSVCGTLNAGWSLCGAVWVKAKNLSLIGLETSATFVTIWNTSHTWKTCNYAVSPSGVNCDINVSIGMYPQSVSQPLGVSGFPVNASGAPLSSNETAHYYRISAISSVTGIESEASSEIIVNFSDWKGNSSSISWSAVPQASSYRVYNATISGGQTSYFTTTNTSFNHTNQVIVGAATPIISVSPYHANGISSAVWIYVNSSTEWRNRTWVARITDMNMTTSNTTNGWNIVPMYFRNGRTFGNLNASEKLSRDSNITMYSMPFNNGTSVPYITKPLFNQLNKNVQVDYGRAMWVYSNHSSFTFDVGGW